MKQKNNNTKNSIRQLTKEDLLGRYVQLQVAEDLRDKNSYSSLAPESLSADERYAICGKKRKKERKKENAVSIHDSFLVLDAKDYGVTTIC